MPKQTQRTARKSPKSPRDAIALLRADHAKVTELFERFAKARDGEKKRTLAREICSELTIHTTIEEEIFYPTVRGVLPREKDLLDEADVEHATAKELIAQIEAGGPEDEKWSAKVTVLAEYIKHHVWEEQNEMFPKVRKTRLDLRELGERLAMRKEQLAASLSGRTRASRKSDARIESWI